MRHDVVQHMEYMQSKQCFHYVVQKKWTVKHDADERDLNYRLSVMDAEGRLNRPYHYNFAEGTHPNYYDGKPLSDIQMERVDYKMLEDRI